jgi:hypothetical protein
MAAVTLVDEDRQWHKANVGVRPTNLNRILRKYDRVEDATHGW